ncbi:MAG: epoxyqueuosine reductase QueH [Nitrospiraceae bacterium]|nr:epoxyqueuosine reductase QueH [Nitrospiraceae bacterium]
MKVLMHICCANCSIYPLQKLLLDGMDILGLWFNPNIQPYTEYANRRDALKQLQDIWHLDIEYIDEYPLDAFLKAVAGTGAGRCEICYTMRLDRTAETARAMNIPAFTTSLLASPYQKFDMINTIGRSAGERHGVCFLEQDMRKGWHLSRGLSKEFGLYRQKYCGCIYSEMERFKKSDRKP